MVLSLRSSWENGKEIDEESC